MPERLKAILDKITAWWKKFNTKQRSVLISIVAVVIVALVILGVVISRPTQVELVEAQSASEASTIKGVLEDNNISYEVDSKLVFFVNKSDEVNAIMALGDNGIPAQAYSIDNVTDGSFSTTEADKQKKYQVYLEDKLKDHLEKQSYVNEASVLVKSLDNLTEKERRVIELYYYEDLTLKEISNILEVSESRVSQLHTKGLIKMRKVMGPYMNILTNA